MIAAIVGWGYIIGTIACFIAAMWTQDLRWLGTGLILTMFLFIPKLLEGSKK